jgi:hypothetical protein
MAFGGKSLEFGLGQQHDENILGHNHAGGGIVHKLGIKCITKLGKEFDRLIEVLYG